MHARGVASAVEAALASRAKAMQMWGSLDPLGDHRAACPVAGILGPRSAPLERAAARICREGGARVATNVFLRDMNVDVPLADSRRIEVLANGLHWWQGAQVAVDSCRCGVVKALVGYAASRSPANGRKHGAGLRVASATAPEQAGRAAAGERARPRVSCGAEPTPSVRRVGQHR